MIEILIAFLGVSLFLYILLGGADFGAGIVELITGKRGENTISKAIAPIWEANHIWIILVVVILFNGFPTVYTSISTYLHIPLLLTLIGIVIRGTSFTFRYYDIADKKISSYYTNFFRVSSILTPCFLGIVVGAVIIGRIPPDSAGGSFYQLFVFPWFNFFCLSTGLFVTLLFAWLASVYLIGETNDNKNTFNFARTALFLFCLLITSGVLVFLMGEVYKVHLLTHFFHSDFSVASLVIATILVPVMWRKIITRNVFWTRLIAGLLTFCILTGWFSIQFPVLVYTSDKNNLTVWNSVAPKSTIFYLIIALIVGIVIIFPALYYLFKVFKFRET